MRYTEVTQLLQDIFSERGARLNRLATQRILQGFYTSPKTSKELIAVVQDNIQTDDMLRRRFSASRMRIVHTAACDAAGIEFCVCPAVVGNTLIQEVIQ